MGPRASDYPSSTQDQQGGGLQGVPAPRKCGSDVPPARTGVLRRPQQAKLSASLSSLGSFPAVEPRAPQPHSASVFRPIKWAPRHEDYTRGCG